VVNTLHLDFLHSFNVIVTYISLGMAIKAVMRRIQPIHIVGTLKLTCLILYFSKQISQQPRFVLSEQSFNSYSAYKGKLQISGNVFIYLKTCDLEKVTFLSSYNQLCMDVQVFESLDI
jgi:hypothetical protein